MVAPMGCAWLLPGVCMVAPGGQWLLWGQVCVVALGGAFSWGAWHGCMHGCSGGHVWFARGVCVVAPRGGVCGCYAWLAPGGHAFHGIKLQRYDQ